MRMFFPFRLLRERLPDARGNALLGAFAALLFAGWTFVAFLSVFPVLPYNSATPAGGISLASMVWAPQGWAFFTRDPREEKQFVYGRSDEGWTSLLRAPHARLRNGVGVNRKSRAQGVEMALLINSVPASAWTPCEEAVAACLERLPPGRPIENVSPNPTMCGEVAVVLQPPVPWAWLGSDREIHMPSRILAMEVAC